MNWQCIVVSLRNTLNGYFPLRPSNLPVVVTKTDERLANRTPKKVLYFGVVTQTQNAWFIQMNKQVSYQNSTWLIKILSKYSAFFLEKSLSGFVIHDFELQRLQKI